MESLGKARASQKTGGSVSMPITTRISPFSVSYRPVASRSPKQFTQKMLCAREVQP